MTADEFQLLLLRRDILTVAMMALGVVCGGLVLAMPQRIRRVYAVFLLVALVVVSIMATQSGMLEGV